LVKGSEKNEDSRMAMQQLRAHYDGAANRRSSNQEDDRGQTDQDKVDHLLNGIQCTRLSAAISDLHMNEAMHTNFEMAANLLQRGVHRVFPFAQGKNKSGVSEVNAADGGGTEEEV